MKLSIQLVLTGCLYASAVGAMERDLYRMRMQLMGSVDILADALRATSALLVQKKKEEMEKQFLKEGHISWRYGQLADGRYFFISRKNVATTDDGALDAVNVYIGKLEDIKLQPLQSRSKLDDWVIELVLNSGDTFHFRSYGNSTFNSEAIELFQS